MPWQVVECDDYIKTKKDFNKKWLAEMLAIATNLDTVFRSLCEGTKPEQLKLLGCVHPEPLGILALTERGVSKGTKPKALRLYLYPDEVTQLVHLMICGDKQTQSRDIALCLTYVKALIESHKK